MSFPFMQLYVADYFGDTQHLNTEQHGAYLLILMTMWLAGGALPNDEVKLARVARLGVARWRRIGGDVMAFFEVDDDQITQKRLSAEIKKAKEKSQKRSHAGKSGVVAKSLKRQELAQANASAMLKHSPEPDTRTRKKEGSVPKGTGAAAPAELFPVEVKPAERQPRPKPINTSGKADVQAILYSRGKEVLGGSAGGVITNLLKTFHGNAAKALAKIEDAAEHRDPLPWINGFLWNHGPPGLEGIGPMSEAL